MKNLISLLIVAWAASGCAAPSAITHEDSPVVVNRDQGPVLCRDGTTPPCNPRD